MAESAFNEERLNFHFLPKDGQLTSSMLSEFNLQSPNSKKLKLALLRTCTDGIRTNATPGEPTYICVICNEKLADMDVVNQHLASVHAEPLQLLRNTSVRPVVGLDLIIEYRNDLNEIAEYECTLCSLFFSRQTIFWHVISALHKEKFFLHKHPTDFINHIDDPKLKQQKIDEALINFYESGDKIDRGYFLYRRFEKGMIESVTPIQTKLNMSYISKFYPTETSKLTQHINREERWMLPLQQHLALKIENEQQFQKGKELLTKMNKALLDFVGPLPKNNEKGASLQWQSVD